MNSLLPPSATQLERNAERACRFELDVPLQDLWTEDSAPEHILPYLAWSLDVDFWSLAETAEQRRALIKGAIPWHKRRGTPWAIKQALTAFGYLDVKIIERAEYIERWIEAGGRTLDGAWQVNGQHELAWTAELPGGDELRRISIGHWAEYAIRVASAESWSRTDQRKVRQIAEAYAPLRSQLTSVIGGILLQFVNHILLASASYKIRLAFKRCDTLSVHTRRALNGCWQLGGDYAPSLLDGWRLSGNNSLNGQRPVSGFQWAEGQLSTKYALRLRLPYKLKKHTPQQLLSGRRRALDGFWRLGEEVLDGFRALNGRILTGPTLTHHAPLKLDGWQMVQPEQTTITNRLHMYKRNSGEHL